MTVEEIIELIKDTDKEYELYCNARNCTCAECTILRKKIKNHDDDISCSALYTSYKLDVTQKNKASDISRKCRELCKRNNCHTCKIEAFENKYDLRGVSCYIVYFILSEYGRLDLLE